MRVNFGHIFMILAAAWGLTHPAYALTYKIFLLAGQSNMVGTAPDNTLPIQLQSPQQDVAYFMRRPNNSTNGWTTLQPVISYGPEVTFGRDMADALPNEDFAIIKYSTGGSELATSWNPNWTFNGAFDDWLQTVTDALAVMDQYNIDYEIAGFVWVQGEADAFKEPIEQFSLAYAENLANFASWIRNYFNQPQLPFVFNQLHEDLIFPYTSIVRQEQAQAAAIDPFMRMVNIDDLSLKGDLVHFTAETQQMTGYRLASAMLDFFPDVLYGDTDGDGDVDFDDLAAVETYFHDPTPGSPGDADYDGDVDVFDLIAVKNNFGASAGSNALIPEPTTLCLLLISTPLLARRRRS